MTLYVQTASIIRFQNLRSIQITTCKINDYTPFKKKVAFEALILNYLENSQIENTSFLHDIILTCGLWVPKS